MSTLLVFNATSRIAQGLVRNIYRSGRYESIVCADVFPNYWSYERYFAFRDELKQNPSQTKIHDVQITERSDITAALKDVNALLYVTHDYYKVVPSKLNLLVAFAKAAKAAKLSKAIAVTPVEYDHYGEQNPVEAANLAENEAKTALPELVHIKSDITFGNDSGISQFLVRLLAQGKQFSFKVDPSALARPVFTGDLQQAVANILEADSAAFAGKSYLAQGPSKLTLQQYLDLLAQAVGQKANVGGLLETIVPPTSYNLLTELLYKPCQINRNAFLKQYRTIQALTGYLELNQVIPKLTSPEEVLTPHSLSDVKVKEDPNEFVKRIIY
eukprot:TRINITY_DN3322_c0_g2_i5.p1 TRINITY_DN3322_c0_g2~~TRINITY_DN3322_c0_g2_i5.p1  ORF type:complete len:328 (+),score=107.76 TRINITY_DN3322_c0_g2_i5:49-1032(+)